MTDVLCFLCFRTFFRRSEGQSFLSNQVNVQFKYLRNGIKCILIRTYFFHFFSFLFQFFFSTLFSFAIYTVYVYVCMPSFMNTVALNLCQLLLEMQQESDTDDADDKLRNECNQDNAKIEAVESIHTNKCAMDILLHTSVLYYTDSD